MTIDKSEFQAQAPSLWVPIYLANIRKQASIKALFWGEENHLRRWAMRDSQRSSIKAKTKLAYWECSDEPSRNHTAQACSASFYPSPPFLWLTWDFRRWTAALRSQIQNQAEESWSHFFLLIQIGAAFGSRLRSIILGWRRREYTHMCWPAFGGTVERRRAES